jgi:hypothetical protein
MSRQSYSGHNDEIAKLGHYEIEMMRRARGDRQIAAVARLHLSASPWLPRNDNIVAGWAESVRPFAVCILSSSIINLHSAFINLLGSLLSLVLCTL